MKIIHKVKKLLIRILKEIKKEIVIIKQAKLKGVKDKDEVFAAIFTMDTTATGKKADASAKKVLKTLGFSVKNMLYKR